MEDLLNIVGKGFSHMSLWSVLDILVVSYVNRGSESRAVIRGNDSVDSINSNKLFIKSRYALFYFK